MKKLLCLAALCGSGTAFAQSTNIDNNATVVSLCNILVTKHLNFGAVNPLNTEQQTVTTSGAVQLSCTKQSVVLNIDFGSTIKGDSARRPNASIPNVYACDRRMGHEKNPQEKYLYNLSNGPTLTQDDIQRDATISNPNYNQFNICDNSTTKFATLVFTNSPQMEVPVYATMTVIKSMVVGNYSDVLTISVVF